MNRDEEPVHDRSGSPVLPDGRLRLLNKFDEVLEGISYSILNDGDDHDFGVQNSTRFINLFMEWLENSQNLNSWTDHTLNEVEIFLKAADLTFQHCPEIILSINTADDDNQVEMYYQLVTRLIPLYVLDNGRFGALTSKLICRMFEALGTESREFGRFDDYIDFILAHINSYLQYVSGCDFNGTQLLPEEDVYQGFRMRYKSAYDLAVLSLSCQDCLCAVLKLSTNLFCTISRSNYFNLILNMAELWEYIKLMSNGFFDSSECHRLFLQTCTKGFTLEFCSEMWVNISLKWVVQFYRHLYQISHDSDITKIICIFILDLSAIIYQSSTVSAPLLKSIYSFVTRDRDTRYLTKNISLALVYFKKALRGHIKIDHKDEFTNQTLETKRLHKYQLYARPKKYRPSNIQKVIRTMFLHSAPTSGTMIELVGHFVMDFDSEPISKKKELVKRVGLLSCYLSGKLSLPSFKCSVCDKLQPEVNRDRPELEGFETIFSKVIENDDFRENRVLQFETMKSLKRVLASFQPGFRFDDQNPVSAWIMNSLKCNVKKLRLAAAELLPFFIISKDGAENTEQIFQYLGDVFLENESHLVESTILAWCQVARVCEGERLNVVLLKLLRMLGSENRFHCALAFHNLQNLAELRLTTCMKMFSPFWPTISLEIVKQLDKRKLLLNNFCELLEVSPNEFLVRTMQHTVPYLICSRRYKVVQQISEICAKSLSKIFFDNQSVILAVLLVKLQGVVEADLELGDIIQLVQHRLLESGLVQTPSSFTVVAAPNIVRSSFEILKLYTPDDETVNQSIIKALTCLGSVKFNSSSETEVLNQLFSANNVLQIVTLCSNTIRNVLGKVPYTTKIQCLHGLSMLIRCAPDNFKSAVPQICAFLQSVLETEALQATVLGVWAVMVENLDGRHLSVAIGLTFSVIMQKWPSLTHDARKAGKFIVEKIIFDKLDIVSNAETYLEFPLLCIIEDFGPDIVGVSKRIQLKNWKSLGMLESFTDRCQSDNIYIVRQTLIELKNFLSEKQKLIADCWNTGSYLPEISDLSYTLLNTPSRFQSTETDVGLICAECLGLIGALDPHKADVTDENETLVLVHNFEQARESLSFAYVLLERFLVKAFISSTDPDSQMYLAYGIQEMLKVCGINAEEKGEMWTRFGLDTRFAIEPLLSSKYTVRDSSVFECKYPIFSANGGLTYNQWLITFTLDLLKRVKGSNAQKIFGICSGALGNLDQQYIPVFNFLLPYAALNVILAEGNSNNSSKLQSKIIGHDILLEIFSILSTPLSNGARLEPFHQTIFSLVDYLTLWMRERNKLMIGRNSKKRSKSSNEKDSAAVIVETFLSQVSADILATRSFECKSYPRAIMYWENYFISKSIQPTTDIFSKFQHMYASIDDIDSLDGISTLFPKFDIKQQILHYESIGRWDYALECYESTLGSLAQWGDSPPLKNIMLCMKKSGRYEDLLGRLNHAFTEPEKKLPDDWHELGVEASWLLPDWDHLEEWVKYKPSDSFEINIGKALLSLSDKSDKTLQHYLKRARENVSELIAANSSNSLTQSRENLVKLHALTDLEIIGRLSSMSNSGKSTSVNLTENFDQRLSLIGSDFASRRYLLALRRSAISVTELPTVNSDVAAAWVLIAQDARKLGQLNSALHASIRASELGSTVGRVENAKILYEQGEQRKAVTMVEEILGDEFVQRINTDSIHIVIKREKDESLITREQAEIGLLYTKWLDSSGEDGSEAMLKKYRALAEMHPMWAEVHYRLAKYCNKLYDSQQLVESAFRNENFLTGEYVKLMISSYLRTLQCGVQYIYETLPKLITVWLDFSAALDKEKEKNNKTKRPKTGTASYTFKREKQLMEINRKLEKYGRRIPSYVFYLVLPQLMSRICVENVEVFEVLQSLICNIAQDYPSRALWPLLGASNSRQESRKQKGIALLTMLSQREGPKLKEVLRQGPILVKALSDLAYKPVANKVPIVTLKSLDFDTSSTPNDLVVPVQQMMNAALPNQQEAVKHHRPFATDVTIYKVDNKVKIQSSMQRPKQIRVYGSDGEMYKILCKPNDDVRKDARLMEFTNSVDKLLKQDDEAARRRLMISTYHVTPLNEKFGLIEWVDEAIPIKEILFRLFSAKGVEIDWAYAKENFSKSKSDELKLEALKMLLNKYPAVLHEWFLEMFPEPGSWLESRARFVRSTAVMSIVGYILGLGDRHYENLLLLEKSGDLMHVDFDCLFNKALELDTPERVPFRLTKNIVQAMGLSGYEGLFRRTCEVTLSLLRNNEDMLTTILETFVHDPIVEWTQKKKRVRTSVDGLFIDRTAEEALATIKNKLRGIQRQDSLALSVSGQVEYVIQQATNHSNLSKMYVGWTPFL